MEWRIATRNHTLLPHFRKICSSNYWKNAWTPICFWDNLKNGNRKYWEPPTHRSPRFLAFFLHILTKNDRFLNLQVTVRRFSRRKLKILLSLISTNWTSCRIDVAISSDSRRPGKHCRLLWSVLKIELRWQDTRVIPSNIKTTFLVLKLA